jgi:hypothetical protein
MGSTDRAKVTILPAQARFYVDAAASGSDDGSSWDDAFNDLRDAMSFAHECSDIVDEIWVAAATYRPWSRDDSFHLRSGLAIYGGFLGTVHPSGGETSLDQRDWVANETILSGDIGAVGDDTDNAYHVVFARETDATAVVDGFTITGGNASEPACCGGGMYNDHGNTTLRHCTFSFNYASQAGGGMYIFRGQATLTDCTFSDNSAHRGGGLFTNEATPTLIGCTFNGNTADHGAGAHLQVPADWETGPTLINCAFHGNEASYGGGVYGRGCHVLTNCTFVDNVAIDGGGGMDIYQGGTTLINCTFGANRAAFAEALCLRAAHAVLTNCILWNGGNEVQNTASTISIRYSNVRGGWHGVGNIDSDPLFANPVSGDLRLLAGSPCIDAGDGFLAPSYDADGRGRPMDDPDTPNTGTGPVDFVDMGAHEYLPVAAFADLDGDGDVDLDDLARFIPVFDGPR